MTRLTVPMLPQPVEPTHRPTASAYTLLDAGASYQIDFEGFGIKIYGNTNNILDQLYVAEANDVTGATDLSALSSFFGFGRTWTAGFEGNFLSRNITVHKKRPPESGGLFYLEQ
ncbi:MAG: TonB-dependent receptor [Bacteroidia bacterium]